MTSPYTGTRHLLRLVLRRDRVRLPLWVIGLRGMITASALAVPPIYDTPEKIAGYASAVGTKPVNYLMSGRQAAIDTIGGIVANEISQVAQLGISLMVMFLVVRHTRAQEETGTAEVVRSTVVGRHAATLAGLLYGVGPALLIGVVTTVSMLAADLEVAGSVTYGVGLALLGLSYVAVSLVAAQLSTTARGALGLAGAAIAIGYVVRGLGAMRDSPLVWASPFGWAQRMDAFGAEQWWPALLLVAMTATLLALATWLTVHRDFGSGVLQPRPGRPHASAFLGGLCGDRAGDRDCSQAPGAAAAQHSTAGCVCRTDGCCQPRVGHYRCSRVGFRSGQAQPLLARSAPSITQRSCAASRQLSPSTPSSRSSPPSSPSPCCVPRLDEPRDPTVPPKRRPTNDPSGRVWYRRREVGAPLLGRVITSSA